MITAGEFTIISGGSSGSFIAESSSAKGIKAVVTLNIDGGTFTINAADDALHTNGSIVINGDSFTIASGDDGINVAGGNDGPGTGNRFGGGPQAIFSPPFSPCGSGGLFCGLTAQLPIFCP